MTPFHFCHKRQFIAVSGPDDAVFLQNIITQDIAQCQENQALWTALLSAQGRVLWDFFIYRIKDKFLLDCEKTHAEKLGMMLAQYRLRTEITLAWEKDLVRAWVEKKPPYHSDILSFQDPRHGEMGFHLIGEKSVLEEYFLQHSFVEQSDTLYLRHRLRLGIPEGHEELASAFPLQNGFDGLNAISWEKGCYPGQEITARTKYRGQVKKHLLPMMFDAENLEKGASITYKARSVGHVVRAIKGSGLGMVKLEEWHQAESEKACLTADGVALKFYQPDWLNLKVPVKS